MSSSGAGGGRTKPVRRACEFCQKRHLKCNGEDLCDQCEYRGLQCVFKSEPSSGSSHSNSKRSLAPTSQAPDPAEERPKKRSKLFEADASLEDANEYYAVPQQHANSQIQLSRLGSSTSSTGLSPQFEARHSFREPDYTSYPQEYLHEVSLTPDASSTGYGHLYSQPQYIFEKKPAFSPGLYGTDAPHMAYGRSAAAPRYFHPSQNLGMTQPNAQYYFKPAPPPQTRLNPDLIIAYVRDIQPFSLAPYSLQDAIELQKFLQADSNQVMALDTRTLIKAFVECVMVAHGCRQVENPIVAAKYADKAFQTLLFILKTRGKAPDLPQNVVALLGGMDLLVIFMVGSDDLLRTRFIIAEAYRLFTVFERHVPVETAHRVFVLKIGAAARNLDIIYFLNEIKKMNVRTDTLNGLACHIALISCLVGRHPSRNESSSITPAIPSLAPEDVWILEQSLAIISATENGLVRLEHTLPPTTDLANLFKSYRCILDGARCICFWQLGYVKQAAVEAGKTIELGPAPPGPKLGYLLFFCDALQVMRCLGYHEMLYKGLSYVEPDLNLYPVIQRIYHDLKDPVRFEDVPSSPSTPEMLHVPPIPADHSVPLVAEVPLIDSYQHYQSDQQNKLPSHPSSAYPPSVSPHHPVSFTPLPLPPSPALDFGADPLSNGLHHFNPTSLASSFSTGAPSPFPLDFQEVTPLDSFEPPI